MQKELHKSLTLLHHFPAARALPCSLQRLGGGGAGCAVAQQCRHDATPALQQAEPSCWHSATDRAYAGSKFSGAGGKGRIWQSGGWTDSSHHASDPAVKQGGYCPEPARSCGQGLLAWSI